MHERGARRRLMELLARRARCDLGRRTQRLGETSFRGRRLQQRQFLPEKLINQVYIYMQRGHKGRGGGGKQPRAEPEHRARHCACGCAERKLSKIARKEGDSQPISQYTGLLLQSYSSYGGKEGEKAHLRREWLGQRRLVEGSQSGTLLRHKCIVQQV